MSSPLGYAVGNSLEVAEAVKYLKARIFLHLTELRIAILAANMTVLPKKLI